MKGDFTRERFDPANRYTRVLKQQGRVELDADWNEQAAIQQHLLRTLVVDLIGPAAGPEVGCGFGLADAKQEGLKISAGDFGLTAGRYYVDGLLIENPAASLYGDQRWPSPDGELEEDFSYLAYLDVWERHVTWLDDPELLEPALGGPDTCTRVQTVWQVRALRVEDEERQAIADEIAAAREKVAELDKQIADAGEATNVSALKARRTRLLNAIKDLEDQLAAADAGAAPPAAERHAQCDAMLADIRDWTSARMIARLRPQAPGDSPCVLPPDSRYRGLENQLYRIEVHTGGGTQNATDAPAFKWSRDNGSIASPALSIAGKILELASARGFAAGCWIEILTEAEDAQGLGGFVSRVAAIDGNSLMLDDAPSPLPPAAANPRARRWDGAPTAIATDPGDAGWLAIEDGIEVRFENGDYRAGDYWLIPARVATGAIAWPHSPAGEPVALEPRGIVHHYAPLFLLTATADSPFVELKEDCRCMIARLPCIGG